MIPTAPLLLLVAATFGIGLVGSLAGLVLGNLRLPLLLSVLPPAFAGGTNVTVSAAGAGAGVLTHLRAGRFDRQVFLVMAPPSVVGAFIGGFLAGFVPGLVLVLIIALIVLQQGLGLIWTTSEGKTVSAEAETVRRDARWGVVLSGLGFGIGVLGGLVGLILGTLRLPLMLREGVTSKAAVATNLAVGFFVGIAALVGHLLSGTVDLVLVLFLAPPAVLGAILGARLAGAFSERGLRRAIGFILAGVGAILLALVGIGVP